MTKYYSQLMYKSPGPETYHDVSCQTLNVRLIDRSEDEKKNEKTFAEMVAEAKKLGWCESPADAEKAASKPKSAKKKEVK